MSKSDPVYPASPELAEHAEAIRRLGKRILSDVVEIGERLTKARALIAHGTWLRWLEGELRWSDETARRFIKRTFMKCRKTTICGICGYR